MSQSAMKSGRRGRATNCGIPYRIEVRDRMLYFYDEGMSRCLQMVVWKNHPHELLYVDVRQDHIPACHVTKAGLIAEHVIGPNHYPSLAAYHQHSRELCFKNTFSRRLPGGLRQRAFFLYRGFYHWYRMVKPEQCPIRWEAP